MDSVSKQKRSENMRAIRSRDTAPELRVRSELHKLGFRFRIAPKKLPGRPDIVLRRWNAVVLIHGCFWHQHSRCVDRHLPATRKGYWVPKLRRNVARDAENRAALEGLGFQVFVVWACEIESSEDPDVYVRLAAAIRQFST